MSERIVFSRWKDEPEVGQKLAEMERTAERHARLASSDRPEDKTEARKAWKKLSDGYWDLLFSLLDAQTASFPEQLTFDEAERLFIDFGFLDGITPVHKDFDATRILASRADADVFPHLAFSDYIAECWGAITAQPCPASGAGVAAEERIEAMEKRLEALQAKRDDELLRVLKKGATTTPPEKLIEDLDQNLFSAMQVAMRVKEYREAKEEVRQTMSQERFRYVEAERILSLQLSSACKDEEEPLALPEAEAFMELHESTQRLARKILYARADREKTARRMQKIADSCSQFSDLMKRRELKNMVMKKREYMAVPAKIARCETSLLCPQDAPPASWDRTASLLASMSDQDMDMFGVPRIRMYGIPRVIFIPGQGLGTYDWQDHSLLLPAFPSVSLEKSVSYALGTFRWDSDEDRRLKNPYEQIKENRSKSILDMAASFCKDYFLWMTKEKKGYRILPRETHKTFVQMFAPRKEEV